jgi:hypothetical protein
LPKNSLNTTLFAVNLQVKGNLRNSQYKFVVGTFKVSGVKKSVIKRVVSSVLKSSLVIETALDTFVSSNRSSNPNVQPPLRKPVSLQSYFYDWYNA